MAINEKKAERYSFVCERCSRRCETSTDTPYGAPKACLMANFAILSGGLLHDLKSGKPGQIVVESNFESRFLPTVSPTQQRNFVAIEAMLHQKIKEHENTLAAVRQQTIKGILDCWAYMECEELVVVSSCLDCDANPECDLYTIAKLLVISDEEIETAKESIKKGNENSENESNNGE